MVSNGFDCWLVVYQWLVMVHYLKKRSASEAWHFGKPSSSMQNKDICGMCDIVISSNPDSVSLSMMSAACWLLLSDAVALLFGRLQREDRNHLQFFGWFPDFWFLSIP